jgi:hypothetical protein
VAPVAISILKARGTDGPATVATFVQDVIVALVADFTQGGVDSHRLPVVGIRVLNALSRRLRRTHLHRLREVLFSTWVLAGRKGKGKELGKTILRHEEAGLRDEGDVVQASRKMKCRSLRR